MYEFLECGKVEVHFRRTSIALKSRVRQTAAHFWLFEKDISKNVKNSNRMNKKAHKTTEFH